MDEYQWVDARGKPIGSKRSRTKRLERRLARDGRHAPDMHRRSSQQ